MRVTLTNGSSTDFDLPAGQDGKPGRELEIRTDFGRVEWRYQGDDAWRHLFTIPRGGRAMGGGGAHRLSDLSDVRTAGALNGYVMTYDAALGIWKPAAGSGGATVPLPGTVTYDGEEISEIALNGGATYVFTYDVDGRIETVSDGTYTKTFSYDVDGRLQSWTVA
jgi:hypothetical protein